MKLKINAIALRIFLLLFLWRIMLQGIAMLSPYFFAFSPSYPYYFDLLARFAPWWIARWAGFDGVHYLTIAMKGYIGTGLIQAFFPVYPLLIAGFQLLLNPLIAGLFVSTMFIIPASFLFVRIYQNQNKDGKWWTVLLSLLFFPTSFFFVAMYSESLFLFLALLSFFFMHKKKWLFASIVIGIASATRITGIFLVPALLLVMFRERRTIHHFTIKTIMFSVLGVAGLLIYMNFLYGEFHDPLYFLHVQSEFGAGRQENLVMFPQVVYRYIRILLTAQTYTWLYFSYTQELVLTLLAGLVLLFQTFVKKWRVQAEYLVFAWLSYILPSLTGTFQSMPRYLLTIFPIYFFIAALYKQHRAFYWLILGIGFVLLTINTMLFFQGYWVA